VLLQDVEVDLVARASVGALEVGRELTTQLHPGGEGPLRQVHEPRSGRTNQGHREIVDQDGIISSCGEDRGGVDLQELDGVDTPVILLRQVGLELASPDHHVATPRS
jgi:hypothetical protein